ncbi:unnamed protein product [Pylaiella littoralis]
MHTIYNDNNGSRRARRRLEPPLPPSVVAASNNEMKTRLSTSSLILGNVGPETRDWSLSSTQLRPTGAGALDPAQRAKNVIMKQALQTAQIVLGEDRAEWGASNTMPAPTGDVSRYRGRLTAETANFIKTSSLKMGSSNPGSQYTTSMSREGLKTPDHNASVELFNSNRSLHDKLREAGRTTRIIDPDGDKGARYERSNIMPDLTSRMHEAKSSPEANRQLMLRIRRSNVQLGDGRIKTLTTTQHDSMDEVVEATSKMEPGFNARTKQDPRYSSIKLGNPDMESQWSTSNKMPNWYAPETYTRQATPNL